MTSVRLSTFSILDHYRQGSTTVGRRLQRGLELCALAERLGYGFGCNVPPVRPQGPPLYVATNRTATARRAGRRGDRLLTLVSPDLEGTGVVRERIQAHRRGLAEAGGGPDESDQAVAILTHVAESDEQAREQAGPALIRFLRSHGDLPARKAEQVFDRACTRRTVLCGSPQTFASGVRTLVDAGARHLLLWSDFGDLSRQSVERSLRLAADTMRNL